MYTEECIHGLSRGVMVGVKPAGFPFTGAHCGVTSAFVIPRGQATFKS